MHTEEPQRIPQIPTPEQGEKPRSERDSHRPTAKAPESVEHSVYEEAEYAGKEGPDAADPPIAARKSGSDDSSDFDPGADLDPGESADVMETREEAHRIKQTREDQRQDEHLINLDPGD